MEILTLAQLTHDNFRDARAINRDDIPEAWVDTADTLMEVTDYGAEHAESFWHKNGFTETGVTYDTDSYTVVVAQRNL